MRDWFFICLSKIPRTLFRKDCLTLHNDQNHDMFKVTGEVFQYQSNLGGNRYHCTLLHCFTKTGTLRQAHHLHRCLSWSLSFFPHLENGSCCICMWWELTEPRWQWLILFKIMCRKSGTFKSMAHRTTSMDPRNANLEMCANMLMHIYMHKDKYFEMLRLSSWGPKSIQPPYSLVEEVKGELIGMAPV